MKTTRKSAPSRAVGRRSTRGRLAIRLLVGLGTFTAGTVAGGSVDLEVALGLGTPLQHEDAYLKASTIGSPDQFGTSIASDGNTVVVGAVGEASDGSGPGNNAAPGAGAVYVLVRDGSGNWSEQAYLKALNPDSNDLFGHSVAISGDLLVVGAPTEDSDGSDPGDNSIENAGAAYVFVRDGLGNWTQEGYLKASNPDALDFFGYGVGISGDTVVVSAPTEDGDGSDPTNNGALAAGAVYVFERDGLGGWSEQAYLKASNADAEDGFGIGVGIFGDTVVVGAHAESSDGSDPSNNDASVAGAAYVFVRDGMGTWSEQAYLKASNLDAGDLFGTTVAISGDTLVVTAVRESSDGSSSTDNSAFHAGAAYVFEADGLGGWVEQGYLKSSNVDPEDSFGSSAAVAGDVVVVGATMERGNGVDPSDNSLVDAGAAYVFVRDGLGGWVEKAYLKASNVDAQDALGNSVLVLSDGTVLAGAPRERGDGSDPSNNDVFASGALYVFGPRYTIGGELTGLVGGTTVVLHNNGGDDLALATTGSFTFPSPIANGSAYAVTVAVSPTNPSQTCSIANGTGTVADADVTDVQVSCAIDGFSVGGSVGGLVGSGLVLQNNGGDDLAIGGDGSFTFPTSLLDGSDYFVSVLSQPTEPDQICSVSNGTGALAGADVTGVVVECGSLGAAEIPTVSDAGAALLAMLLALAAGRAVRRAPGGG